MAVIQISKIQVRRGLAENLPNLASGEFGWSIDAQRLYIGNGTVAEGAPATGLTEIFTEHTYGQQILELSQLTSNVTILQSDLANTTSNISSIQSNISYDTALLVDNTTSNIATISMQSKNSQIIDYTIVRDIASRVGTIQVTNINGQPVYQDEYSQTADTGITLSFVGNSSAVVMRYSATSTGVSANLTYYTRSFI